MSKFRKKPVEIEAIQLPTTDEAELYAPFTDWCNEHGLDCVFSRPEGGVLIPTREGQMRADLGDWIIRGVKGEFYPCKPDIFELTYEPA